MAELQSPARARRRVRSRRGRRARRRARARVGRAGADGRAGLDVSRERVATRRVNGGERAETVVANGNVNTASGKSPDHASCASGEAGGGNLTAALGIPSELLAARSASAITSIEPELGISTVQSVSATGRIEDLALRIPPGLGGDDRRDRRRRGRDRAVLGDHAGPRPAPAGFPASRSGVRLSRPPMGWPTRCDGRSPHWLRR